MYFIVCTLSIQTQEINNNEDIEDGKRNKNQDANL